MNKGWKFAKFAGVVVLCLGSLSLAAGSEHSQRKAKKPQLPPLASGPMGPVPQIPLDSIAPIAPQVSYQSGQLTIVANNSTLGDILRAVHKQTGAEIEIPAATDRVVTNLGPGPARDVMAELLNGSRFNYVLLGSPEDASVLTRVVLVAKSGADMASASNSVMAQQPAPSQAQNASPQETVADTNDADAPEENADENAEQPAQEAEQPVSPADQPGVKTPQQLLQEMQQRQLQMQQQQQQQTPGQPPVPGAAVPPPQQPPQQEEN